MINTDIIFTKQTIHGTSFFNYSLYRRIVKELGKSEDKEFIIKIKNFYEIPITNSDNVSNP